MLEGGSLVLKGEQAHLRVVRMGQRGEGVAEAPTGQLVFIPGVLPGETARVEITEVRKNFARARLLALDSGVSAERVEPPCPVYEECGGCVFQHWDYGAETRYKEKRVEEALRRIGGFETLPVDSIRPIRSAPNPYGYRAKGSFPWGGERGSAFVGLYAAHSHRLIPVTACGIQDPHVNRVLGPAQDLANQRGWEPYREATDDGLLRHLVIRSSRHEQRVVVLLVVRRADPELEGWARELMDRLPLIKGVAANLNDARTNRILGRRTWTLAGDPTLSESILGKAFALTPDAFFQVNPVQVEVLYQLVLDAVGPGPYALAMDLFSGVGTLAVLLSDRASRVLAVELSPEAVREGRGNAQRNRAPVEFVVGAAEEVVPRWVREGARPDVMVLDPPRSGVRPPVLETIRAARPQRLVYVSCDPETLARDLGALRGSFVLEHVTPVDMFPRTDHVEVVASLIQAEARSLAVETAAPDKSRRLGR